MTASLNMIDICLGEFVVEPAAGWADWNGEFRDLVRQFQNRPAGTAQVTPGWLADRVAASSELFRKAGRKPWSSINYITSHDGLCLRDLYVYNVPSGENGWDQGGDWLLQRQAATNSSL